MSDVVSLARRISSLDVSPQFGNYSKVVIHVSDETTYVAGNDTGRTLEIENPFGTQAMARNILAQLTGYQYQPYTAQGALLDPAAEIGDAVNMRGAYGGIYTRERTFGRLMKADVSAPHDEEINHEYQFESPEKREFKRSIGEVKASLIIANDRITAEVTARQQGDAQLQSSIAQTASEIRASVVEKSGGSTSSFGWSLTSSGHRWYAGNREVMAVTASGLVVNGVINAKAGGTIGGFNIGQISLYNNLQYFGDNKTYGVYVGNDGIQLGQSFKVNTGGEVTATRLWVDTLYIGGQAVSASDLNARANNGNSAYGWTSSNGSYAVGGAGYGYNYNNATNRNSGSYPSYFRAGIMYASNTLQTNSLQVGSYFASWKTATIAGTTINYLGR